MAKTYDPNTFAHTLPDSHRQWIQNLQQVVNGGIEIGTPEANSPAATSGVNQGLPTQYKQVNGSGIMIRVDAAGVSAGATYNWTTDNTGVEIKHGLQRTPIGFHVVDKDGNIQVYRTVPSTDQLITLAPSDATKSVTVYIF
ncbi:MAG: hypothetical protein P4L77_12000 [Sulfuriferula sp.]|nr:hypothetical protein [Sulfuriferula sp.]